MGTVSWVMGDYWEGCIDEELELTYPIVVKDFQPAKKIDWFLDAASGDRLPLHR